MRFRFFCDDRIEAVRHGAPLTVEERAILIEDLPTFDECPYSAEELDRMDDRSLMEIACVIWWDYSRSLEP